MIITSQNIYRYWFCKNIFYRVHFFK